MNQQDEKEKQLFFVKKAKKSLLMFAIFLSLCLISKSTPQHTLQQKKTSPKKSRRIVKLEEVLRIHDNGEDVIFKNPRYFSCWGDGSFLFMDWPFLYRYDDQGNLLFKIFNQGDGPGECKNPSYYYSDGVRIYIHSWIPPKILQYDINGKYIKEQKVSSETFVYIGYIDNKIFGIRDEIRYSEFIQKNGFFDTPYTLYEISSDFRKKEKILDIPVEHYIKNAHWWRRTGYVFIPHKHYLFCLHTAEYQVDKINIRSGQIEKIFKRPYDRIKSINKGSVEDPYNPAPKNLGPPPEDYVWDIWWIQIDNEMLWAFTSTFEDEMELIDVFDMEGNYIDYFYLEYPENNWYHGPFNNLITDDGYLFAPEENKKSGLVSIGKYRIVDD